MRPGGAPTTTTRAMHAMVASADQLATQAGMTALALGGSAVDAAIAANAAIAVCGPHLCGLGGDLFALVHHRGEVHALLAVGRAGSGADAGAVRAEGLTELPLRHDIRTVTVPGFVDGWLALHERFATLPVDELLAPAIDLAAHGFPASPLLVGSLARIDERALANLVELTSQAVRPGAPVRRPGVAAALGALAATGRDGFYGGPFGEGLLALGGGWFSPDDLTTSLARWVTPLRAHAWGVDLWTIPPNSQGYLALGAAELADGLDLPDDPDDDRWAHLLVEAATAVGHDRVERLHDDADGAALVRECAARAALVDPERASSRSAPSAPGETTYLCARRRVRARVAHPVERLGLRLVAHRAEHRDQPAQPRPRVLPPGRAPRRARAGPAPATHAPAGDGHRRRTVGRPCSARWAATPSHRSSCSSRRGCSATANRPPTRCRPGAGCCAGRSPGSTRGRRRAGRWCPSRVTRRRNGPTAWPAVATRCTVPRRSTAASGTLT